MTINQDPRKPYRLVEKWVEEEIPSIQKETKSQVPLPADDHDQHYGFVHVPVMAAP